MPINIPVTIARVRAKTMQENPFLVGVLLHRGRQNVHGNLLTNTEVAKTIIGIEDISAPDALQKRRARRRIGPNLNSIAQGYDKEFCSLALDLAVHYGY